MFSSDQQDQTFEFRKNTVISHGYSLEENEAGQFVLYRAGECLLAMEPHEYFVLSDLIMIMDIARPNLMPSRTVVAEEDILVKTKEDKRANK